MTTIHPDLKLFGVNADVENIKTAAYTAQKPYKNGITVYTSSGWLGNGFGTETTKVAVNAEDQVVGVYENSGYYHRRVEVLGCPGGLVADIAWTGHGQYRRSYTTKTALSKWIAAVKAL